MRTAIVISTRGFGVFLPDLLEEPDQVRFVGVFAEGDASNLSEPLRARLDEIRVVPCGVPDPSPMLTSLVDLAATRAALAEILAGPGLGTVTLHCFDEQNMIIAAALRGEFGLPGPGLPQILPYRDKILMKERLVAAGVRVPKFGRYDPVRFAADPGGYFRQITADVGLPFILKPLDSACADGVRKITSAADFSALPADLGRAYEYEEFIDGAMFSVNIVSQDGATVFGGVTEYLVNSFDVQDGRVNADINLSDADPRVARMVGFGERALDALGRLDGATHLELFLTAADEMVFLEVAARFKGMAGLAAMQRNYGLALVNMAFEIEAGVRSRPYANEQVYCFDGVVPKIKGVVDRLFEPRLESEVEMTWKVRPGDAIDQSDSLQSNGGTFLVSNKDYDTLYRDFQALANYTPITYRHESAAESRVLGIPAADPATAADYFRQLKLGCETDPYDVHHDLEAGADGFVLLDARRTEAYRAEHIPQARNLPHQDMTPETLAELDPDTVYVVYGWGPGCNGGTRAAAKLADHGLRVKEMIGGMEYWKRQGYPTQGAQ